MAGHYFADKGWQHKDITNNGDFELLIMVNGTAYIQIGEQKFVLQKHECLLVPPFIRHIGYKGSPPNTVYYWVHFYPRESVQSTDKSMVIHDGEIAIPQLIHIDNFSRIVLLMRQILDVANTNNVLPVTADLFISSLAAEISNQFIQERIQGKRGNNPAQFEIIKNWIRIHIYDNLTVDSVARHFELSPTYLTHLFHSYDQVSTIHFINSLRVHEAQELLLTTDLSIKQIAQQLNLKNEKYFYRLFKQVTGTTAKRYRNAYCRTYMNNIQVDHSIPKPQRQNFRI